MGVNFYLLAFYAMVILKHFECGYAEDIEARGPPPGPPTDVYAEPLTVTDYSVRLVWSVGPRTDHDYPIMFFDVEAETQYHPGEWQVMASGIPEYIAIQGAANSGKRADQRSALITGLIPNTVYRFRVRVANVFGLGEDASQPSATIKTHATSPLFPVRGVEGGGGTIGTLSVKWNPLDISEYCGPGLGYSIYWKLFSDTRTDWSKSTISDETAEKILTDDGQTKVTFTANVGLDNVYRQYEVKIGVFNILGDGPNSTVTIIYSAEGS